MSKFLNWKVLLTLIIVLAGFLRLWRLGEVPISLADDEVRQVYTSYSIAQTGRDYFGNFLPVVIKIAGYSQWSQPSLYISSLFYKFLPLNPFSARLPYALFGIISIIFFYLVVKDLFKSKAVALFSSFVLSVSIWHIQLSRLAMDIDTALLMYIVGIYFFLKAKNKTYLLIFSMIFMFLAFYTYGATRVIFIPLILILIWYRFKELVGRHFLIIVAAVLLTVGSYSFLSVTQGASNYAGNPFFFQNRGETALNVELERRASSEPNIIKTLYLNKFTYWGKIFLNNYLDAFSPQYLFLGAERDGRFAIWEKGELYMIELPLLLFGIFSLFLKKRREFYFIFGLLLISPLPSGVAVGTSTWVSRSGFMIYPLYVFIGFGIYSLVILFKKIQYRILILLALLLIYIYSVTGYTMQYYYDWSRRNAEYFSKSTQDLVYLIHDYKDKKKEIVVSDANDTTLIFYAFYNKLEPSLVQKTLKNKPIKFENILFQSVCISKGIGDPREMISKDTIYISPVSCHEKVKSDLVIKTYDNTQDVWKIYVK